MGEGPRPADASAVVVWSYRLVVGLIAAACVWTASITVPEMGRVPADFPRRLEATYLNVVLGSYALLLSLFLSWKVGGRREGRVMSLALASTGMLSIHAVAPSGALSTASRVLVVVALFLLFWLGLRLWTVFPQTMDSAAARSLLEVEGRGPGARLNRFAARVVATMLDRPLARLVYYAAVGLFSWELTMPGRYEYSIYLRTSSVAEEALMNGVGFPAVLVTVAFAWTAFRLADVDRRNRVLWIVLTQVAGGLWVLMAVIFGWLDGLTGSRAIHAVAVGFLRTQPLSSLIGISGFAVAIFYSGALDLRPIINKTTAYGSAFMVLTFLFAGVEEIVESQVVERLGVSEGVGTWIAAALVALAIGPVRTRADAVVRRIGASIEPAPAVSPVRDGVPGPP